MWHVVDILVCCDIAASLQQSLVWQDGAITAFFNPDPCIERHSCGHAGGDSAVRREVVSDCAPDTSAVGSLHWHWCLQPSGAGGFEAFSH